MLIFVVVGLSGGWWGYDFYLRYLLLWCSRDVRDVFRSAYRTYNDSKESEKKKFQWRALIQEPKM